MTVKELKEKLKQFPEDCIVLIPNELLYKDKYQNFYVVANNVTKCVNELDNCVFIDGYIDEE